MGQQESKGDRGTWGGTLSTCVNGFLCLWDDRAAFAVVVVSEFLEHFEEFEDRWPEALLRFLFSAQDLNRPVPSPAFRPTPGLEGGGGAPCVTCRLGGTPPSRPAYVQPLSPQCQVPASKALVTDLNRPPTAFVTSSNRLSNRLWDSL